MLHIHNTSGGGSWGEQYDTDPYRDEVGFSGEEMVRAHDGSIISFYWEVLTCKGEIDYGDIDIVPHGVFFKSSEFMQFDPVDEEGLKEYIKEEAREWIGANV